MDWYRMVWQKYAQFDGRSRRKEYWMFGLINFLIYLALIGCMLVSFSARSSSLGIAFLVISCLYGLAAIIPGLAVNVRRLHDVGRSGWWLLLVFIPFGGIVLLVFHILDGNPGPNAYGPDPKNRPPYGTHALTLG